MKRVLTVLVASTFALAVGSAFAKQEDLTASQRADLRARADQLTRDRANGTEHMNREAHAVPVTSKKHHVTKHKKTTHHTVKKSTTTESR